MLIFSVTAVKANTLRRHAEPQHTVLSAGCQYCPATGSLCKQCRRRRVMFAQTFDYRTSVSLSPSCRPRVAAIVHRNLLERHRPCAVAVMRGCAGRSCVVMTLPAHLRLPAAAQHHAARPGGGVVADRYMRLLQVMRQCSGRVWSNSCPRQQVRSREGLIDSFTAAWLRKPEHRRAGTGTKAGRH